MITPRSFDAHPIRTLLADDHCIVRAGIREFLETANDINIIAEASDGISAKTLIEDLRPDVAVLDIRMPGASGIEVTRWVRSNIPDVGVLILTAYDDDPYVMAVLQAGANGYILKTASPREMVQAVREVNARRPAIDPVIAQKVIAQISRRAETLPVEPLTDREMEVLRLTAKGCTNRDIGAQLEISDRTVQGHLAHIFEKLKATTRTEAVMRAVSLGWIQQNP